MGLLAVSCTTAGAGRGVHGQPGRQAPASTTASTTASRQASRPLRVLVVGDSVAGTLGVGLAEAAAASDVTLVNGARGGCGVGIAWDGAWTSSYLTPVPPVFPCQSAGQLIGYWRSLLDRYHPDVVVYAARVDTIDQTTPPVDGGRTTSILDGAFQGYLQKAMTEAVAALSSTGAHVVLGTSVPTEIALRGNANDDPRRWSLYARIIDSVAAGSSGAAGVFDLGRFFGGGGPQPIFLLDSPSGARWRCTDGIHVSARGGMLVAPALFRMARELAGPLRPDASGLSPALASVANKVWPTYQEDHRAMGCPE